MPPLCRHHAATTPPPCRHYGATSGATMPPPVVPPVMYFRLICFIFIISLFEDLFTFLGNFSMIFFKTGRSKTLAQSPESFSWFIIHLPPLKCWEHKQLIYQQLLNSLLISVDDHELWYPPFKPSTVELIYGRSLEWSHFTARSRDPINLTRACWSTQWVNPVSGHVILPTRPSDTPWRITISFGLIGTTDDTAHI